VRLFLAVELDRAARGQCDTLLEALRRSLGDAASALRWTPAENVHITLHFLGEVDRGGADRLIKEFGALAAPPAFDASTSSFGAFPPGGPPKIVWLGIGDGATEMTRLQSALAEPVRRAGFQPEQRPFSPHLTIARVRDREHGRVPGLRAQLAAIHSHAISWRVDHVTLFKSDLSGSAPRYESLINLPLV
jgi:2'-5' RNA ligase